jgi:hypothetical protein
MKTSIFGSREYPQLIFSRTKKTEGKEIKVENMQEKGKLASSSLEFSLKKKIKL